MGHQCVMQIFEIIKHLTKDVCNRKAVFLCFLQYTIRKPAYESSGHPQLQYKDQSMVRQYIKV